MKTEMYCYLEDRERRVLPSNEAFDQWLDPARSAVLEIDMHRGHVGPEEALTLPVPRSRARVDEHNAFQAAARDLGVPVVHVQHWQRHGGIDDANSRAANRGANWRVLYELYLPPNELMLEHSWEGTPWLDLITEEVEGDYYVRTKKRLSGFYPTDLEFLLRQLAVTNVVLTGTMTDACVLSTAFDAANRDFRVIVPRDIVAGYNDEAEHGALMCISLHAGLVVDGPALLREWAARAGKELPSELRSAATMTDAVRGAPVGA
jgi:nicotinamidase-related amidase